VLTKLNGTKEKRKRKEESVMTDASERTDAREVLMHTETCVFKEALEQRIERAKAILSREHRRVTGVVCLCGVVACEVVEAIAILSEGE
jgi:hypothetical protein